MLPLLFSKYKFATPNLISEEEFKFLKNKLDEDVFYEIKPNINFYKANKTEFTFVKLGIVGVIILIFLPSLFLKGMGFTLVLISIGILLRLAFSYESYLTLQEEYILYNRILREDIICSNDYLTFCKKRELI